MRRLITWNLMTLDGYFEAKKWDIGFHETVWGEELERFSLEQSASADLLLFGRVTYEGMAAYWSSATGETADFMNRVPKVVFSRTLKSADWSNARLAKSPPEEEAVRLKRADGKDILVFGSAELCATLLAHGLVDEVRVGLVPVLLGGGTPLFKPGAPQNLELVDTRPLSTGCVILSYRPLAAPTADA
jgi:dihydrofolate reductase